MFDDGFLVDRKIKMQISHNRLWASRSDDHPSDRCGFTMVELLIVMTVIAILIALLLPALSRARDLAIRVKCAASQRQIGVAYLSYSFNFKGRTPVPTTWGAASDFALCRDIPNYKKYNTDGATGLGLLYSGSYTTSGIIFYCPGIRIDSIDTPLLPFAEPVKANKQLQADWGKAGKSIWGTYQMIRTANIQRLGTAGASTFQDADGIVTNARPDPFDGYQYIGGVLDNNLKAPAGRFYPLVSCMQTYLGTVASPYGRWSHLGQYTNRLAADGSVRPLGDFNWFVEETKNNPTRYMYSYWTELTSWKR